jgi:hypothetical protein
MPTVCLCSKTPKHTPNTCLAACVFKVVHAKQILNRTQATTLLCVCFCVLKRKQTTVNLIMSGTRQEIIFDGSLFQQCVINIILSLMSGTRHSSTEFVYS